MSNDKMNWATIAPESRIYKGKTLYRWDVSPGLDARAKATCLGKHVEPCYRFHQQLHFIGKSHECFGCNASDELHHSRHKEILRIIRQINSLDKATPDSPSTLGIVTTSRIGSIATSTPTDTSSEMFVGDEIKLSRRERKKAKKSGNGIVKDKKVEVFSAEELGFISEAIHLTKLESKGAWAGTYNYDEVCQEPPGEDDVPELEEDLDELMKERLERFTTKHISKLTPRQRKTVKIYSTPTGQPKFRGGSRKFTTGLATDVLEGVDPQIFFRLGIEVANPATNSRVRRETVAKLVAAIKEDLEIIAREAAESAIRREGFWRWAGKSAFELIVKIREDIDWATGQKIEKDEARRESDPILAGEHFAGAEYQVATPGTDPRPKLCSLDRGPPRTPVLKKTKIMKHAEPQRTPDSRKAAIMTPKVSISDWMNPPNVETPPSALTTLVSAWSTPTLLKFEPSTKPTEHVKEHKDQNKENDTAGWEVVKRGRGAARAARSKWLSNRVPPGSAH